MKFIITLLVFIPTMCVGQWVQLGGDIDGVQEGERLGSSTDLNALGDVVIVGAPNNSTNGTASGQGRILEWDGTSWIPKGNFLTGDSPGDNLGQSVSMNDSGDIVALGAPGFLSSPSIAGYAKVYQWNGTDWSQLGATIEGSASDDSYGTAVDLNADGSIVAVSAEPFFANSYVRVFEWDGDTWSQLGDDIVGTSPQDGFGRTISLNAGGTVLAVGVTNFDGTANMNGMLRIYEWNGESWEQKGSDLIGDNELDNFGAGVSVNDDGTIVAAGARATLDASSGYVKVFEWNGTDWAQKGNAMLGNAADFFGDVNDLNDSGDMIISGTILGEYAKILKFIDTDWVELDSISGESSADQFGISVSMNHSGSIVSVGAFGNDAGGNQSGHLRVFENASIVSVDNAGELPRFSFCPNPTQDFLRIWSTFEIRSYRIVTLEGKTVEAAPVNGEKELRIDFSDLSKGMYQLILLSDEATRAVRVVKD